MEDREIVQLFERRDERAIAETAQKYGAFCRRVAGNIVVAEDAEECVNDAYHTLWKSIPPECPQSLRAFLGRVIRNLALSRYRAEHAQKRGGGMQMLLSELEDCLPADETVERELEREQLSEVLSDWLVSLPREERTLFVRRYWYGDAVQTLAAAQGCTQNQMAQRMRRLRQQLKTVLETEGVSG